jgi:cytochrome c553
MFKQNLQELFLALVLGAAATVHAGDTTPAAQLQRFEAAAGRPASAENGRIFFTSTHGSKWTCASCHGLSRATTTTIL